MKNFSIELIEMIASWCTTQQLCQLSLVNNKFYSSVTRLLYKQVMITAPRQYLLFKNVDSELLTFVRRLDFSSYSTRGSRYTEEKAKSILVPKELAQLIMQCTFLKEIFVGEEMMHAFVSPPVIRSIFSLGNKLEVIDFTGFCDRKFTAVMADFFKPAPKTKLEEKESTRVTTTIAAEEIHWWSIPQRLKRISFYMCMALSQDVFFVPFFDKLAAAGNSLERLDLAYTHITSDLFLHMSAKSMTHLNLQGCHGLTCCSPLVDFLIGCQHLVQLNLNMDFNGMAGSRFCHHCLYKIVSSLSRSKTLQVLDLGGHLNLDDALLQELPLNSGSFSRLNKLSLTYCKNISLEGLVGLLKYTPNLNYINLSRTQLTQVDQLPRVFQQFTHIQSVEVSPLMLKKYPLQVAKWKLSTHGRRSYYSVDVDSKYLYSKKLLLVDHQELSPMNKYWCYSY